MMAFGDEGDNALVDEGIFGKQQMVESYVQEAEEVVTRQAAVAKAQALAAKPGLKNPLVAGAGAALVAHLLFGTSRLVTAAVGIGTWYYLNKRR